MRELGWVSFPGVGPRVPLPGVQFETIRWAGIVNHSQQSCQSRKSFSVDRICVHSSPESCDRNRANMWAISASNSRRASYLCENFSKENSYARKLWHAASLALLCDPQWDILMLTLY